MLTNKRISETDNRVTTVENPTPITLTINDQTFSANLNDSSAAKDLISRLPLTVKLSGGTADYCGQFESLPYEASDVQNGWFTGDISFDPNGDWFVIFIGGDNTKEHLKEVTLGQIEHPDDVEKIAQLGSIIEVAIAKK